jgi:hypothetical protein
MFACHPNSPIRFPARRRLTHWFQRHAPATKSAVLIYISTQLLLAVLPARAQPPVNRPEIWFTPRQEARNPDGPGIVFNKYDFPAMIKSDDGWQRAASHIAVMQINAVGIMEAYHDVQSVLSMINRHDFRISVSGSVLYTNHDCNVRGEGITNDVGFAREFVINMQRWAKAGGRTDYITMDSPLVVGYYVKQKECHFTIDEVAKRAATTVNMVLQQFPKARIVDAVGPSKLLPKFWYRDYSRFVKAFNLVSKKPIEHLSLDMHWTDDWHTGYEWVTATRELADYAHADGLRVGLIFNADARHVQSPDGKIVTDQPMTDALWMQAVRDHLKLARDEKLPLDFVMIDSWVKFPYKNLPDSDPNAFTSLVNYAQDLWFH